MYLLDTNILIYALKGVPAVVASLERHRNSPLAVSAITLMELYYGAHKSQRVESNLAKVRTIERSLRVIPVDVEAVETFGALKARLEVAGTPLDDFDLVLAATALAHNLTLVTNDTRHFGRVPGLCLANWAEG